MGGDFTFEEIKKWRKESTLEQAQESFISRIDWLIAQLESSSDCSLNCSESQRLIYNTAKRCAHIADKMMAGYENRGEDYECMAAEAVLKAIRKEFRLDYDA